MMPLILHVNGASKEIKKKEKKIRMLGRLAK